MGAPPSSAGVNQGIQSWPGVSSEKNPMVGAPGGDGSILTTVADQSPAPAEVDRAQLEVVLGTSAVSPLTVYVSAPELQTLSRTVQLSSALSAASLRM